MRIAQDEIFGPVLSVFEVDSYDEAVDIANDTKYGLSSSIYTEDVKNGFRAMRDLDAGITYVNGPTIGAEAHMPFGGVKGTGNGHRDGGWAAFEFFRRSTSITPVSSRRRKWTASTTRASALPSAPERKSTQLR